MAENRNSGGAGGRNRRDNSNSSDGKERRGNNRRDDQQQQQPESDLREKMVALNRVAKVTKGGRTFTFAAIVVVGDGKGKVGQGMGKARDISEAIQKATDNARKSMITVPLHKGTIPHEQLGKYGAGKVLLKPASEGTGVIAGGAMRAVLDIAGVHNVLAKSQGSSNPHNVIKATLDALTKLRSPMAIAKQRGISMEKLFEG
ncbi:30S ribosomal protein S5 [Neolewinella lacunae]|uniref:Small ribosomal subunit protein uS5 n=1 Tax=Neolewinella lacunae TaxID=1517758 RepID=A0A923PI69_9BACT|nr:30S ribosomal protein S5 [Neolewinella lacunae]MBC6993065.1 30S ribosomal protein S5 [Neolewinella lacunae]MDN3635887.1 30S ribosomal protein S5 [Neolewinella lacunae]